MREVDLMIGIGQEIIKELGADFELTGKYKTVFDDYALSVRETIAESKKELTPKEVEEYKEFTEDELENVKTFLWWMQVHNKILG